MSHHDCSLPVPFLLVFNSSVVSVRELLILLLHRRLYANCICPTPVQQSVCPYNSDTTLCLFLSWYNTIIASVGPNCTALDVVGPSQPFSESLVLSNVFLIFVCVCVRDFTRCLEKIADILSPAVDQNQVCLKCGANSHMPYHPVTMWETVPQFPNY